MVWECRVLQVLGRRSEMSGVGPPPRRAPQEPQPRGRQLWPLSDLAKIENSGWQHFLLLPCDLERASCLPQVLISSSAQSPPRAVMRTGVAHTEHSARHTVDT